MVQAAQLNRRFPADEFVTLRNVPIFAEHETVTPKGRKLKFDRRSLQAVADRCNRRIRETGDYAALSLGHTPEPGSSKPDPEVVGFAGPFRLEQIGQGGKKKYAITADFHIFKEDLPRVKKHPRRSPELFVEDRYEEMFLDPIALLGAEPPRLDMGILYSARRHGREIEKYAAAAPAAGSVFVPSTVGAPKRKRYAAEEPVTPARKPMAANLSPEDVQTIVDALEQLDWVQYVKGKMAEDQGNNGTVPEEDLNPGMEDEPAEMPMADDTPPAPEAGPGGPPMDEPPAEPMGEPDGDEEQKQYSSLPGNQNAAMWDQVPKKARADKGKGAYDSDKMEGNWHEGKNYGAMGGEVAKFSRIIADQQKQLERMRKELDDQRIARAEAVRYSQLAELRTHYAFDMDREVERCRYSKMNDEQFSGHLEAIQENYRPIPTGTLLPQFDAAVTAAPDRPGRNAEKAKYSRALSDKALEISREAVRKGQQLSYEDALKQAAQALGQ